MPAPKSDNKSYSKVYDRKLPDACVLLYFIQDVSSPISLIENCYQHSETFTRSFKENEPRIPDQLLTIKLTLLAMNVYQ
jgi:hypothetical protein